MVYKKLNENFKSSHEFDSLKLVAWNHMKVTKYDIL